MLEGYVGEVKMDALHEHIGGYKHLLVLTGIVQHGAVIAHSVKGGGVLWLEFLGKVVYKSEFAQLGNLCAFYLCHIEV